MKDLLLICHRGGKGFGPENTLESLAAAIASGVEMIETDVRMSSDGVPFIHHSPFSGLRLLGRMKISEIRERFPEIPLLREYLEMAGEKCRLNLEVKRCDAAVLAEALGGASLKYPLLVSSFDAAFLEDFRKLGTGAEIGLLAQYELVEERLLREAKGCGATVLLPASYFVTRDLVSAVHFAGLRVITWTVNGADELGGLIGADVDGIITDDYTGIREFLESEPVAPNKTGADGKTDAA